MSKKSKKPLTKKGKMKRLLALEVVVFLIVIVIGSFYYFFGKMNQYNLAKVKVNDGLDTGHMKDYTNIALFGVDSQSNKLGKGNRSDSIIIASINKKTKDVKLLSIFRDTYVHVEGHDYTKINHAYAYGGPELALKTINENFDLNIQDFVTVNFSALAKSIDALGGVEITVESDEIKNLNDYIGNINKINGGHSPKVKKAGKQILDGNQATAYARIRYTSGGDFRRAQRQRTVIEAMLKTAKSHPTKLISIANNILPQVLSSLSAGEVLSLAKSVASYDIKSSKGFPFDNQGQTISGIYYGLPVTLKSNTKSMHKYFFGKSEYKPSKNVSNYSAEIEARRYQ